jgi:hypothetical protein
MGSLLNIKKAPPPPQLFIIIQYNKLFYNKHLNSCGDATSFILNNSLRAGQYGN